MAFCDIERNLLEWLEDFLVHAKLEADIQLSIRKKIELCKEKGFKVHAQKVELFIKSVWFCDRKLDAEGMPFNPRYLQSLKDIKNPNTVSDLQQFHFESSWMRNSIPNYATEVAPLHKIM